MITALKQAPDSQQKLQVVAAWRKRKGVLSARGITKLRGGPTRAQEPLQRGYGLLLQAMLEQLGCFAEPRLAVHGRRCGRGSDLAPRFQNMRWLENKKQLLVYHHAARMHDQRDAILASLAGAEAGRRARLDPVHDSSV